MWLPNISHKHTHTRTYTHALTPTPSILRGMRTSALNFVFGTRLVFFPSRWPATPSVSVSSFHSSLPHRSVLSFKPKTKKKKEPNRNNLEERFSRSLSLFFLSGNKNKLNGKTQVFFYLFFFFQIQGTMSINIPICLSVFTPRFSVRTSRKLLDCLLIRRSLQLHISLVCTLTLLRDASVLVERATAKSKPVINNEQN